MPFDSAPGPGSGGPKNTPARRALLKARGALDYVIEEVLSSVGSIEVPRLRAAVFIWIPGIHDVGERLSILVSENPLTLQSTLNMVRPYTDPLVRAQQDVGPFATEESLARTRSRLPNGGLVLTVEVDGFTVCLGFCSTPECREFVQTAVLCACLHLGTPAAVLDQFAKDNLSWTAAKTYMLAMNELKTRDE